MDHVLFLSRFAYDSTWILDASNRGTRRIVMQKQYLPKTLGQRLVYAFNTGAFFRHTRLLFRVLVPDIRNRVPGSLSLIGPFVALWARMGPMVPKGPVLRN